QSDDRLAIPGLAPRYAVSFPGLEISDGGEFTVYKKGPAHPPKPKSCRKTRYLQLLTSINGQAAIYRGVGVVVQTNNPAFVSNSYKRDLPHRSGGPDADPLVPVSSGHLARRLLAGPVEATGNGRSQIRCDGGSPCPAPSFCWCSAICAHQSALRWRCQFRLCCGSESPPSTTRTPQSIGRPVAGTRPFETT